MSYLNQVMLIGYLGKDPEVLKETATGCFVRLSLGTNKKYTTAAGEKRIKTQWHTVYLNNALGKKIASYYKKGDLIYVAGALETHPWEDAAGDTQYPTAIYASVVKPLALKARQNGAVFSSAENSAEPAQAAEAIEETLSKTLPDA